MSFAEMKPKIDGMPVAEQRRLAAYLAHLQNQREDTANEEPREPDWITVGELKQAWGE